MTSNFPPVRACLFDVDGLLLNTEDLYTEATNIILAELNRPLLPWSIKAQLQGRPFSAATNIFMEWAKLPISTTEYFERQSRLQLQLFPTCVPLPGVTSLLQTLANSGTELAIATSSNSRNFVLKSSHLQEEVFKHIPKVQQVIGDDPRIKAGRGKPAPDIYLLALETVNDRLRREGKREITPEECLVFEDAVPGVEAARRAGMRVVWVPHQGLLNVYKGKEEHVLAGLMGEMSRYSRQGTPDLQEFNGSVGELGDGKGELRLTLEGFDYARYGIVVNDIPPLDMEYEESRR